MLVPRFLVVVAGTAIFWLAVILLLVIFIDDPSDDVTIYNETDRLLCFNNGGYVGTDCFEEVEPLSKANVSSGKSNCSSNSLILTLHEPAAEDTFYERGVPCEGFDEAVIIVRRGPDGDYVVQDIVLPFDLD